MTVMYSPRDLRTIGFGYCTERDAANLPQTTTYDLFTVSGGRIAITAVYGDVTTLIVGAVNLNLRYTPSGGSAADLCAATVCDDDAVGTLYSLTTGVAVDLLSCQKVGGTEVPTVTYVQLLRQPIIVPAGALNLKASASRVGQTRWAMTWVPIDVAAAVVAA